MVDSSGIPVGLQVQPGKTLALVGGDVALLGGNLTAEAGRIELGSVAGSSLVSLTPTAQGWMLGYEGVQNFRDIQLSQAAIVDASGEGGGNVQVQGKGVTLSDKSGIFAHTLGIQNGGGIFIRAEQLNIKGASGVSANTFSSGTGGNVSIKTGNLLLQDGAYIDARTFDQGQGGDLTVNASGFVELIGTTPDGQSPSGLFTRTQGAGSAGKLTIETGQLIVRDGAEVFASTVGTGRGGTLEVTASELVEVIGRVDSQITNGGLYSQTFGVGTGGNLTIKTGKLIVRDSGEVVAETLGVGTGGDLTIKTGKLIVRNGGEVGDDTFGSGKSGNLSVTASESVEVIGSSDDGQISSKLFARTEGVGTGADMKIETGKLIVRDGGQVGTGGFGSGKSGNLSVTASESVELVGAGKLAGSLKASGLYSQTQGAGDAGDLRIDTRELVVRDGARISSATLSLGNAGNIQVNATNFVNLSGVNSNGFSGGLFASTSGVGQGGNITVNSSTFRVTDGAVVNALATAEGNGGNITVNAKTFEADNGGQVLSTTRSSGRAGNIILNVTDNVTLSGSDPTYADRLARFGRPRVSNQGSASGLFANTDTNSTGDGGNIFIDPIKLTLTDGASIAANSFGKGNAGNLVIQAHSVALDRGASLFAETFSSQGGNIDIGLKDILLLRQGSRISTNAGTGRKGGDGGNIAINAPNGFIIAPPKENSDITANAFQGQGGFINITTSGVYGLERHEQLTPLSDITAFSQQNPQLNGTVQVNTPDVDPNRGLTQLPINLVDASSQIDNSCSPGNKQRASSFTITGRGGLPPNPRTEPLTSDAVEVDWVSLKPSSNNHKRHTVTKKPTPTPEPIVQATGWTRNALGEVVLTADASNTTPTRPWQNHPSCHGVQNN